MTPASLSPSMQSHSCSEHGRRAPVPTLGRDLLPCVWIFLPCPFAHRSPVKCVMFFWGLFAQEKKSAGDWLGPKQHPATTSVCPWESSETRKP